MERGDIEVGNESNTEFEIINCWVASNSSVLDLGCGDGELLAFLVKEKRIRPQGIDIDETAICKCVEKGLSVFHQDIDSGLSEYPDRSFDFVILSHSLQQVKKLEFVLRESIRVGKKVILSFPNFAHYTSRFQIFFKGKVPVTPSLPFEWHDTPNLHFLSVSDFIEFCVEREIKIEASAFIAKNKKVKIVPNFFAETGFFLISK